MTKQERELELEALLKSNQDRVRASNNIQTSFNAFNDFINVADKKLNNKMDLLDDKIRIFEKTLNNIQSTQINAINSLHKETIQTTLNEKFRDKIEQQYQEINKSLNSFDDKFKKTGKTIEKQYNDLYSNNISVIALKSFYGLFYVFYIIVCIGSLICFNTIENIIAHKTLSIMTIASQILIDGFIAIIPYLSWKFFLGKNDFHYSQINQILVKASLIGFTIGFAIFFSYVYFYMTF